MYKEAAAVCGRTGRKAFERVRARSMSDSSVESPLTVADRRGVGESPLAVKRAGSSSAATCNTIGDKL